VIRKLEILGIAIGVAAALAQPAAAGLPQKKASFKATIVGTQTSQATLGPSDDPGCPAPSGQSTETVQFKSAPFKLKATYIPFVGELFLGNSKGRAPLTAKATVTRSNSGSIACRDDPGQPRDCGTKTISKWKLSLVKTGEDLQLSDKVGIALGEQGTTDLFRNCTHLGPDSPQILLGDNTATVSKGRLFNRRKKKIVAKGKGSVTKAGATTTLTYKLTLKRR
jgi:hypothetical protein